MNKRRRTMRSRQIGVDDVRTPSNIEPDDAKIDSTDAADDDGRDAEIVGIDDVEFVGAAEGSRVDFDVLDHGSEDAWTDADDDGADAEIDDFEVLDAAGGTEAEFDIAVDHHDGVGTEPEDDGLDAERSEAGRSAGRDPGTSLETRSRFSVYADGGLGVADDDGNLLHYAPAKLTTSVRYLVARLQNERDSELPKAIGFTSTLSGEGVSVLAKTFATVLANDTGHNVCLVDLNWWTFDERTYRPDDAVYGVYETLWMDKPLDSVLLDFPTDRFAYLPAGSAPSSVLPTLAQHPRLPEVIAELAGRFDHLVLDLPAVMATSDAISLSQFSDQVVLVVQQGVAARSEVQSALDDLGDTRPVAAVLNKTRSSIPKFVRRVIGS